MKRGVRCLSRFTRPTRERENFQEMQRLPGDHAVRGLQGLARQIALPGEYAPMRFPSFPALERTALMGFNAPATLNLPASTPVKVAVCRQASYPVWADQSVTDIGHWATWITTGSPDANVTSVNYSFDSNPWTAFDGSSITSSQIIPQVLNVQNSPWGKPLMGVDPGASDSQYMFVPSGYTLYVSAAKTASPPLNPGVSVTVTFQFWNSPGENGQQAISQFNVDNGKANGGQAARGPNATGYWITPMSFAVAGSAQQMSNWAVTFLAVAGDTTNMTFTSQVLSAGIWTRNISQTITSFVPLVSPSEYSNSTIPWSATRLTAVGFLGTNVSQVLNKAGTILGGRVSPSTQNMWNVGASAVNNFHPAEKAWLPLETGVYTYTPPSTDLSQFWDYTGTTLVAGSTASYPVYRLDNSAMFNVMFLTAGSVAESLAVTVSWHLEFRTSSSLFQIALSGLALETLHQAQLALASAGYFFCNPDHKAVLSQIVAAARKLSPSQVGYLKKASPAVHKVVRKTRKAHKYLKEATTVKPKTNFNKMKATTARASGITSGGKGKGGRGRR